MEELNDKITELIDEVVHEEPVYKAIAFRQQRAPFPTLGEFKQGIRRAMLRI